MLGAYFRSALPVVLPEATVVNRPPTLRDYIAAYFTELGQPVPTMTDGVQQGFLSTANRVEVLLVAIDKSTWVNVMLWINHQFENAVRNSACVRCYAPRVSDPSNVLHTEVIGAKRFMAFLSTPYEQKTALRSYTEDLWNLHVPPLFLEAEAKAEPAHVASQPTVPLPPAPRSNYRPKPLTPPRFTRP